MYQVPLAMLKNSTESFCFSVGSNKCIFGGFHMLRAPGSEPLGLSYGVGMKRVNFILSLSLYSSYIPGFIFQTDVGASFIWLLSLRKG